MEEEGKGCIHQRPKEWIKDPGRWRRNLKAITKTKTVRRKTNWIFWGPLSLHLPPPPTCSYLWACRGFGPWLALNAGRRSTSKVTAVRGCCLRLPWAPKKAVCWGERGTGLRSEGLVWAHLGSPAPPLGFGLSLCRRVSNVWFYSSQS